MDYLWITVIFFISCLDSHSDGTHPLQRIHWWIIYVMLHFSNLYECMFICMCGSGCDLTTLENTEQIVLLSWQMNSAAASCCSLSFSFSFLFIIRLTYSTITSTCSSASSSYKHTDTHSSYSYNCIKSHISNQCKIMSVYIHSGSQPFPKAPIAYNNILRPS